MERSSRQKLRLGHVIHRHRLKVRHLASPVLIFSIAQGNLRPATWAHAYVILPDQPEPISRRFAFDAPEMTIYCQQHPEQPLRWLDGDFMLQLALDQVVRQLPQWLSCSEEDLAIPELIDTPALMRHRLNGDFPQLEALLAACGQYYLFHQELQALQALPQLHSH